MSIERIIDAFQGDERSKQELKKAYKKTFKLKLLIFFILTSLLLPSAYNLFSSLNAEDHSFFIHIWTLGMSLGFGLLIPLVMSVLVGNFALHFFTRHLKLSLPETIAPKVEWRPKNS